MNLYINQCEKSTISYFGNLVKLKMICRKKEEYGSKRYDVNLCLHIWDIPWFIRNIVPAIYKARKDIIKIVEDTQSATTEK